MLKNLLRTAIASCFFTTISGCVSYQYIPTSSNVPSLPGSEAFPVALNIKGADFSYNQDHISEKDWKKMQPVMERSFSETLAMLPATSEDLSPSLEVNLESNKISNDKAHDFLTILSLTLIPGRSDTDFKSTMTVTSGGKELFRSNAHATMRRHMSAILPTPLTFMMGDINATKPTREMSEAIQAQHLNKLYQWTAMQKEAFDSIADQDIYTQRQWLVRNPDNIFSRKLLGHFANNPPKKESMRWHQENVALFPGYIEQLPQEDAFWFVGPKEMRVIDLVHATKLGKDQRILATYVENGGPYKAFNDEEIQRLKSAGLSSTLIASMISRTLQIAKFEQTESKAARYDADSAIADLLVTDNSGAYMNPWTSDGVLADWVDKATNAKMGSAVGSAVGAYAASKALENIPFVGGFLGSKVGKEVGRKAAISASGGMEYIRTTSDQSFNSLADMAKYLTTVYATDSNFQDAIKAADAIYPGLLKEIASSQ